MRYNYQYLKSDELDWFWDFNKETNVSRLILRHIPSGKQVSGSLNEGRLAKHELVAKKRGLLLTLTERLEDIVFDR